MASDMDKPQGFSVIGRAETARPPRPKPVGVIWGLGEAGQRALADVGIRTIADLRRWDRDDLIRRFGSQGMRLYHLARGEDTRRVARDHAVKSISNETTFNEDIADATSSTAISGAWPRNSPTAPRPRGWPAAPSR
jgi:DNA polymerase-4